MAAPNDDADDWQWIETRSHDHTAAGEDDDNEDDNYYEARTTCSSPVGLFHTAGTWSNSSIASSPRKDRNFFALVMPKEQTSAAGALQCSVSEWIEPQLVFSEPNIVQVQCFELYDAVKLLQNLPKAKETLMSVLQDPVVWDAVMSNEGLQELMQLNAKAGDGNGVEPIVADIPTLYNYGKHVCQLLKEKISNSIEILFQLLHRKNITKNDIEQLDTTVRSSLLLTLLVLFLIIGKRLGKVYL